MKLEKIKKNHKYTFLVVVLVILTGIIIYKIYDSYAFYKNIDSYDILKNKIGTFNSPKLISALSNDTSITLEYGYDKEVSDVEEYIYYGTEENNLKNKISGNKIENLEKGTTYYFKKCFKNESNIEVCSDVDNLLTAGIVSNFDYTGSEQTYTPVCNGTYQLETWGAQGGSYKTTYPGGYGAYAYGNISLKSSFGKIYVYVGGKPIDNVTNHTYIAGGYNGGGATGTRSDLAHNAGGGATHIAKTPGLLATLSEKVSDVLIVAGGGGGSTSEAIVQSGTRISVAGSAGGIKGNDATTSCTNCDCESIGTGGTQTFGGYRKIISYNTLANNYDANLSTGTFGQGGNGDNAIASRSQFDKVGGSGGGSGFYGGSGNSCVGAGGGGSSYIGNSSLTEKAMYCYNCSESEEESTKTISTTNVSEEAISNYAKKGNGYARITLLSCNK